MDSCSFAWADVSGITSEEASAVLAVVTFVWGAGLTSDNEAVYAEDPTTLKGGREAAADVADVICGGFSRSAPGE